MNNLATQYTVSADQFPATTAPYRLGALSAQLGEICCPEMIFIMRHEQKEFCRGFVSVVGHTITTRQILGAQ